MSLIRFQKASHSENELKVCPKIDQGKVMCAFFGDDDKETPLLWTKGMNPCTGIIIYGKVEVVKNSQESSMSEETSAPVTESFVAMLHDEGAQTITKQSSDQAVEKYCRGSIQSIFSQIEEEAGHAGYTIKKIELNKSFFIRCIPEEKDNMQHKAATAFKVLLASQNIKTIAEETGMELLSISVKEDYHVECIEENEKITEKDSSDMHCYIRSGASGELEIIYHHADPLSKKLTTSSNKEEQEENDEEEDDEEEEKFSKKTEKVEKDAKEKPITTKTKRKFESSESSSLYFSQNSRSVYSDSSSTLFSSSSSSSSSSLSTSDPTSAQENETTPSKKQRPGSPPT
jgi:hypothetical protein